MKTVGIIQARMTSTRLPGKVLADVNGKPMLWYVIGRARQAHLIDAWMVATSDRPTDDAIEDFCRLVSIDVHRGSEMDVLDRYYSAARAAGADTVVRLTADCPLLDGEVIDLVVSKFHGGGEGGYDYVSNVDPATFPDGLDTEVFSFTALARAWRDARLPSEREHVTPYIRNRRDLFRAACVRNDVDLSHYRWTVDEAEDLELVRTIYSLLPNLKFSYRDVLNLIVREPRLGRMNAHLARNEGYLKSLQMDQKQSRGEKG